MQLRDLEIFNNMMDEVSEIFEYLPIRSNSAESEYVGHLWAAIDALSNTSEPARPFIMMPFHLLFMLSLQYKVLRIAKELNHNYLTAFTFNICRDDTKKVSNPDSVFTLTKLNESSLIELFKLIGCDIGFIGQIKALIKYRNDNLAHANGGIEVDPEARIEEYLRVLRNIQNHFSDINDFVFDRWESDIEADQDIQEYVELHLAEEYLCPADFRYKKLSKYKPGSI